MLKVFRKQAEENHGGIHRVKTEIFSQKLDLDDEASQDHDIAKEKPRIVEK